MSLQMLLSLIIFHKNVVHEFFLRHSEYWLFDVGSCYSGIFMIVWWKIKNQYLVSYQSNLMHFPILILSA